MDHHYVPQFYLRYWADPDGRIPHYRWLNDRAVYGSIRSARGAAFQKDLYAREHVPDEERHTVETHFFSILDDRASKIHAKLERRERFTFTAEERHDWAIFLAAANARTPDIVQFIKKDAEENLRKNLNENPEEIEKALGRKPEFTLVEWAEKHAPEKLANFGLQMLLKYLTRDDLIQQFMDMEWTVHQPPSRHKELLTCDRPLWYFGKPDDPKFTMMMTLSPRTVFIAAKTMALADKMAATPSMKLARLINESVFNRAYERVYGRTTLENATKLFKVSRRNQANRRGINTRAPTTATSARYRRHRGETRDQAHFGNR
jgi:hypothetical protein